MDTKGRKDMAESRLRPMELRWRGARLRASTPLDFRGDPDPWTPTHAVMAGIANCLTTAFMSLAHSSGLPVISYRVRVGARTENLSCKEAGFSSVILEPEIQVIAEDVERAAQVFGKAVESCFSGDSLRTTVRVEPRFVGVPIAVAC